MREIAAATLCAFRLTSRSMEFPIGKPNGCFQRLVGKLGFVMSLVLRAQAFQNLNRFFDGWRFDLDCLKSAFERCIFFDVLPVLIEGGGSNALQFAPAKCRFDNV